MICRKGTVLWSVVGVLVVLIAIGLQMVHGDVPAVAANVGIPEEWPHQVQIGAAANANGEAVSFWVDYGEIVKMQVVTPSGGIAENMKAVAGCGATQATVAIGGRYATVFLLCANGISEVVRFDLETAFPGGEADPQWVFLPFVAR